MLAESTVEGRTRGRAATSGVIPGDYALSVGNPNTKLPDGWSWQLLTDLARLESGHTPSRRHPEYWDGDVPWIGIRDATSNHGAMLYETLQYTNELGIRNSSARILPTNTVCLSRTASVGFVVVMGVPMATSQDFVNWICGPNLDYRFLKYVLLAEHKSFLRFASGTTHQTIYFPEVKAFHLACPSLNVQQSIADALSVLDARITLAKENNSTLIAIAQALHKSWFVDFDPVVARASGREPAGIASELACLFPTHMTDTALGPIPEGWKPGCLGDICAFPRRQAKPEGLSGDTTYIGLEHMPRKSLALVERGTAEGLGSTKFWFEQNDILFGKLRPYFHKVGLAPCTGVCSTDILVVRPKSPDNHAFLAMHLFSDALISYATQLSNGAKMPRTSWQDIANFKVALPSAGVMAAYDAMVQPLFEKIHQNIAIANTLANLRDTLLPRLISGRLHIEELQEELTEAIA